MNNLQSFSNFTEHCGCDHSEDKKKKSKVTKEEIIKEYGDPTVSKRLRVARAIDSTFRGKAPKYNSKRAKISNALKMSSIKAETKKRKAKENPYSAGKKLKAALGINSEGYLPEEGYDIARDMGMVKPSKDKKDATTANHTRETETDAQRKLRMLKQQKNTARAVENVKQRLRDKYGKNAIMDVGKKNEEVEHLDELSKTTTANYLYHAKVDKNYVHGGKMGKYAKARDKGIQRAEKKLGKKVSDRVNYVADTDTRSMRQDSSTSAYPRKIKVKEEVQLEKVNLRDKSTQYARSTKEVDTAMTDHVNRTKGRHYGKDGKVTEVGRYRRPSKREARNELIDLYKESYGRGRLTSTNDMQSKLYAKNNSMGKPRTDDEIRKEKGGQAFLDRIKAAKSKMKSEGTSYGLYKGTGKPSGPMAAFAKKTKKKKEVKEEMGNIAHTKTKKGGKTIINVNKNDEADAQKAMKNDPKYILGKTRVQSYKEEFYQKRYTSSGYKPVGKNKRMDQSNKRSGDSKAQYRDLHKDLAKYGHVKTGKASNLKSGLKSFKESAWQRKEGKNPSGGLNEKGRKSYERENPGSDLKAPVTGSPKPGSKADKRQNNFCKRMGGMRGPMKDEKGRPTRKALALKKWNCRSS
jgi:hypothetical protein|tara:strand:- start:8409 stop:10307 length:1899 start_codon:yes stop_codon:yes gene_type:complete